MGSYTGIATYMHVTLYVLHCVLFFLGGGGGGDFEPYEGKLPPPPPQLFNIMTVLLH